MWAMAVFAESCLCGQGVPEKTAQSLSTTILQPYTTELYRFQQNVQKENVYMINVEVCDSLEYSDVFASQLG